VSGAAAAIATAGRGGIAWMFAATLCFAVMGTAVSAAHAADPGLSTFVTSGFRSAVNLAVLVAVAGRHPRSLLGDGRPALWVRGALGGLSLLTVLSRIGQGSRVILTHDVGQRDNLRVGRHDGVVAVVETLKGHPLFAHVTLTRSERSAIAALVTEMLEGPISG